MDSKQSRQLAQDENTAPKKLKELANCADPITRQNVVANPNVPPDVLIKLAEQFPRQVFNNPAIDLLLLETPNLFSGTSADALCSLLKREVPERAIEYALNSTDERFKLAILMNPQTSSEILEQLARSNNYQIAESTALHINFNNNNSANSYEEFVKAKIQQKIVEADQGYKEVLGIVNSFIKLYEYMPNSISHYLRGGIPFYNKNYSHLSESELEKIADSGGWQELQHLGKNPNTPTHILTRILENRKGHLYNLYVAQNPNLTVDLIRKLLECPDSRGEIGSRIGINPSTPVEILAELAKSNRHSAVHSAVALNKNTPNYILEIILNRCQTDYVCEALGRNKKLTKQQFFQLANKSSDAWVAIYNNPNAPDSLKEKLLESFKQGLYSSRHRKFISDIPITPISEYSPQEFINNLFVDSDFLEFLVATKIDRLNKFNNPKTKAEEKSRQYQISKLQTIAFHPNISASSLRKLLKFDNRLVRSSAIANKKMPRYITEVWGMPFLKTLYQNELKIIASSFYTTEELLKELVNHKDIVVSRTAASNPCATDEILEEWQTSPYYKEGVLEQIMAEEQKSLDRWESSISSANRLTALLNSEAPIEVLAKISRSTSWLERYAITQNPKTPHPIVQRLAEDGNRIVRAAAKAQLNTKQ